MKRFWIGAILLAVLLVLGLWVTYAMDRFHEPIAEDLERAARLGVSGDLEQGLSLAGRAKDSWEAHWHEIAAVADHAPMEEIDSLFAQLEPYAEGGLASDFAACCARLSRLVSAMGDAHGLNWWNLI